MYHDFLFDNTPGTADGPGGHDRTLAVKSKKIAKKSVFFLKKKNHIKKYGGKQIFANTGDSPK